MSTYDLEDAFGHCWDVRRVRTGGSPWAGGDQVVVCQHGYLYAVDSATLGAVTDSGGAVAERLREIDGVSVVEDGKQGANVIFSLAKLRFVQRVIQPRRASRRRLDPTRRVEGQRPRAG